MVHAGFYLWQCSRLLLNISVTVSVLGWQLLLGLIFMLLSYWGDNLLIVRHQFVSFLISAVVLSDFQMSVNKRFFLYVHPVIQVLIGEIHSLSI